NNNKVSEYTYYSDIYYSTILFSDNEIKEISYYNHINQFLREKTYLSSFSKIENLLISFLSYKENLSYIPELDYLPTHIELRFSNLSEETKQILKDILLSQLGDNLSNSIDSFILLLESELRTILPKEIKKYFYIKDFILKLTNTHQSYHGMAYKVAKRIMDSNDLNNKIDIFLILEKEIYNHKTESIFREFIQNFIEQKSIITFDKEHDIINIPLKKDNLEELLLSSQSEYFELMFYQKKNEKKIYFNNLSSGEKIFINFFAKLYYYFNAYTLSIFNSMGKKYARGNKENVLILLDEPDINLHPYWQKKFISYLIQFLTNSIGTEDIKIHIILTTHSPFLLSDIPEQNIIFLDKD
ncbi:MAG: AAA family ATPase, partial [Sulfurovaceae bacterium]|nr:AAA family ATPase [Sulfurovaceae bacterium]